MYETVGEKIKHLRKLKKFSQKVLSHNVCSQSEISKIEKNHHQPSYPLLVKIASKLNVNVSYFQTNESVDGREDYIKDVKRELSAYRRDRDYKKVNDLIQIEFDNPIFYKEEYQRHLLWHKGIVAYHYYANPERAIILLINCLTATENGQNLDELDLHILNSLGIIYRNEKLLKKAEFHLKKAYDMVQILKEISDDRLLMKIKYNLSKVYTDLGKEEESIKLCLKGLKHCKEKEDLFLLTEFNYQIGRNYLLLKKEEGMKYWERAIDLSKCTSQDKMATDIEKELKTYRNERLVT